MHTDLPGVANATILVIDLEREPNPDAKGRFPDVQRRIAQERVPCLLETCYKDAPDSRESAPLPRFSRPGKRGAGETVASHGAF